MTNRGQIARPLQRSGPAHRGSKNDQRPDEIHYHFVDRKLRVIFLHGEEVDVDGADPVANEPGVDFRMADRFIRNLHLLSSDSKEPILIDMATCGGDVEAGMSIFNAILTAPVPITVLAHRHARSMSSIIPLAADKFVLMPSARFMYHEGSFAHEGHTREAIVEADLLKEDIHLMLLLYTSRLKERGLYSRWSEKRIMETLSNRMKRQMNVYVKAQKAVEEGFADAVFDGNWDTLRATKINTKRRKVLLEILARPIDLKTLEI